VDAVAGERDRETRAGALVGQSLDREGGEIDLTELDVGLGLGRLDDSLGIAALVSGAASDWNRSMAADSSA
jgi:hypothetical protein